MRGSIIKRSKKYYIVIDLPRGNNGKRQQKWITKPEWTTKQITEKALPRIVADAQDGLTNNSTNTKFSELLEQWHESVKISLRHNSLRSYRWAVNHINEGLGRHKLTALKPLHIQQFLNKKSADGLSNTSLRMLFAVTHKALKQAVDWQIIRVNPCDHVNRPAKKKYKASVYDQNELQALLNITTGTPVYLPVLIAIATGMRRSEIAALQWDDIDFKDKSLTVSNTFYEGGLKLGLQPVKTQLSNRVIVLPEFLLSELQNVERKGKFLICNDVGKPYNPSYLWRQFKDMIRENGLPDTRFQDLRHAHATHLIMQGVPVKTITERLGHYSTAFTQDIYGHVLRPMQDQAATTINELLANRLDANTKTPQ